MWNLKILPYNMNSESAKDLAQILNVTRVRPDGAYVPKHFHTVINWGLSREPEWGQIAQRRDVRILNNPDSVNRAANKLTTLQTLSRLGVLTPEFTTNMSTALQWLNSGATVIERHELRSHSGLGVRVVNQQDPDTEQNLTLAPLYTKFINKTNEFRVHVFRGRVIDYIEKKRVQADRRGENFSRYISSTERGWVFTRTNIRILDDVKALALRSVQGLGLDFGAVDIVLSDGMPYVLEVNSAPGLKGTTLIAYANAIRAYMGIADLPEHVTRNILDAQVAVTGRPVINETAQQNDVVTIQLDRATANKLKELLRNI